MADNHLYDDDAILIARALKQNTNLQCLNLGDNDITDIGCKALTRAVYDSTSLNSMADCNHSCTITGIGIRIDIPSNQDGITPMDSRMDKIYHLLSLRNREGSNVQHLNLEFEDDDSLALVPRVLESVHRYSRDGQGQNPVHPLSIMYEILHSWKMPDLYENSGPNPNNSTMVSSMTNSFYTQADAAIASANLKKNSDKHTQNALKRLGTALDRFLYARNAATAPPPSSSSPHPQSNSNNGSSLPLHVGKKRSIDNIRDNDKDDPSLVTRASYKLLP